MAKKIKPRKGPYTAALHYSLKNAINNLNDAFPAGMAPVGKEGAWVWAKDYEQACKILVTLVELGKRL